MEHTPIKGTYFLRCGNICIQDKDEIDWAIASYIDSYEANAQFIVKAVNNHDALVEACKEAILCKDVKGVLRCMLENAIKQLESEV